MPLPSSSSSTRPCERLPPDSLCPNGCSRATVRTRTWRPHPIAEAPSTKNFESVQEVFCQRVGESKHPQRESLIWKQIRYSVRLGVLPRETLWLVKIQSEAPSLIIRDKGAGGVHGQDLLRDACQVTADDSAGT